MEIKDFYREEGRLAGFAKGFAQGFAQGYNPTQIATLLKLNPSFVNKVCGELLVSQ
ncbi:MAG TPA: hypothetical protein VL053_20490 [Arachidicoccus sp.]|nr:hypothetical protein [Arachidicoccus sp.]